MRFGWRSIALSLSLSAGVASSATAMTDSGYDINTVLEKGTLSKKDCDAYHMGIRDEETTLRCGKWMFFYDTKGKMGMPAALVDLIRNNAKTTVGKSMEGLGLYKDPFSKNELPIGLAPAEKLPAGVNTYMTTCASCHFAQTPDGRYVVGQPNLNFDFAQFALVTSVLPNMALQPKKDLPPMTREKLQPVMDEFFGKAFSKLLTIVQVIRLLPAAVINKIQPLDEASMELLAKQPRGVLDPLSPPAYEDNVSVPMRILPLWGIPDRAVMEAAGSQYGAMLTSSGGTPDFNHIYITGLRITDKATGGHAMESYDPDYYEPLTRYILSLKAPKNQQPVFPELQARGSEIFAKECASCHNGPAYSGTKIFDLADIGTDPEIAKLYGPDGLAEILMVEPYEITRGVRAMRLEGWWSMNRMLHNGSLNSFAELICLAPRPASKGIGYSSEGHTYACDGYSPEDKFALIHFLESL